MCSSTLSITVLGESAAIAMLKLEPKSKHLKTILLWFMEVF